MSRVPCLVLGGVVLCLGLAVSLPAGAQEATRGAKLYDKHCAACHGADGRGDGPAAFLLSPKPRDFTRGEFRLITTTNGVPSDEDLLRVVTNGMPGSAMPAWDRLPEADRRLVVGEVKKRWRAGLLEGYRLEEVEESEIPEYLKEDMTPGPRVSYAKEKEPDLATVARGRVVYTQACAPCHGLDGRGKTNQVLLDSRKNPAPARDFTKGIFKGGSEPRQILSRLRSGMKGTAMPTYGVGGLSEVEAWAVVHYIRTLFPPAAQARQQASMKNLAIRRADRLPASADEWWRQPIEYVALMPLWWRDERVEGVLFQAVHDGKTLAIRLVWEDATQDASNLTQRGFHDGAAVQLSWDDDPPFFGMGDGSSSVAIWSWKASWEEDRRAGFRDLEGVFPHMNLDSYFPAQKNLKAGERPERDKVGARFHDPKYLTGWGAGNPMSDPDRPASVEVIRAKGQGTVTTEARAAQTVSGKAVWDRGVWTLEIRAAVPADRLRALFIAFGVWNGSQLDRNGQKSVSIWHRVGLE